MEKLKIIELNGFTYQIRKMTPRDACYVFSFAGALGAGELSKVKYTELQNECLNVCSRMQGDTPTPVLVSSKLAFKDLEEDPAIVFRLTMEAMAFNNRPLLDEAVKQMEAEQASSKAESSPVAK